MYNIKYLTESYFEIYQKIVFLVISQYVQFVLPLQNYLSMMDKGLRRFPAFENKAYDFLY